jgi:hypothetical protein
LNERGALIALLGDTAAMGFPHNVLDYGHTIGAGSASDVLNNPAVIAAYIGTQAIS